VHQTIIDGSLLCGKEASNTTSLTELPSGDGEARAIVTAGQAVLSEGGGMNTRWPGEKGIGRGLIVSIMLHAVVIAVAIVCSTDYVRKHEETITVFLADSEPSGERGSVGKAPVPAAGKVASPAMTGADRTRRSEPAVLEPAKPFAPEMKSGTPTSTASAAVMAASSSGPSATAMGGAAEGQNRQGGTIASATGAGSIGSNSGSFTGQGMADSGDGQRKEYLARNFGYIRDLIVKNLKYPYAARRMGWKGSVTVALVILENGTVETVRVIKSSGHDLLDRSVLETVRTLQPFPKPPSRAEVIVPITFRLE
jgi:protein TonB